ncbi:MAG: hypothetical protein ACYTGY_09175 [Planctomycetota bacterium]
MAACSVLRLFQEPVTGAVCQTCPSAGRIVASNTASDTTTTRVSVNVRPRHISLRPFRT